MDAQQPETTEETSRAQRLKKIGKWALLIALAIAPIILLLLFRGAPREAAAIGPAPDLPILVVEGTGEASDPAREEALRYNHGWPFADLPPVLKGAGLVTIETAALPFERLEVHDGLPIRPLEPVPMMAQERLSPLWLLPAVGAVAFTSVAMAEEEEQGSDDDGSGPGDGGSDDPPPAEVVPEPSTLFLLATGLALLGIGAHIRSG